jgi:GH25 family lysozyme M1 (1,4-beta-N-acetylmuramidase)
MTMANVIDISEYQDPAKFDYQAAKSNGIKAVIIRLSVGNRRDNHAAEHIANCKKYGLKWHGYHYWYNLSGEAAFAISDAQSLGLTSSQYFFLDMEDKTLSSDWSAQFESFRSAVGGKCKVGLYCSDSPYKSHFDNAKMVAEGVYRWIAAYSYEPANYDTWQMSGEGSGGFGSYTGDVDRDYDKTGNLFKEEAQPITPSTTPLYRQIIGEAGYDTDSGIYGLGRSYDNGKTFHVMDTVYGRIYRQQDGDSIWPFLQPKVGTIKGEKGDKGADGTNGKDGKDGQTWQPYIADDGYWHIKMISDTATQSIVGVLTSGDADILTVNDSYRVNGTISNVPTAEGLLTVRTSGTEVWQTYIDSATADCYTRTRHNGTWSKWRWTTQWPNS